MKTISVTQYANTVGITRQAVLKKIKDAKLPKKHAAKKVGNQWNIEVPDTFGENIEDTY